MNIQTNNFSIEALKNKLEKAIQENNIENLNIILEEFLKVDINISNDYIFEIIYYVIKSNNIGILDQILKKIYCYDIDITSNERTNLILMAIKSNSVEKLNKILKKFYSIDVIFLDEDVQMLIRYAIDSKNINILNNILEKFIFSDSYFSPKELYQCIIKSIKTNNYKIVERLLYFLENREISVDYLYPILHIAIFSNNFEILNIILQKFDSHILNLNLTNNDISYLIRTATDTRNIEIVYNTLSAFKYNMDQITLVSIVRLYNDIIFYKKETFKSLRILNQIFKKISITLINKVIYDIILKTISSSLMFFLDGNSNNSNSKNILNIIQKFYLFNKIEFNKLIFQKKMKITSISKPELSSIDPISVISSFL
jgi:hypothetical protein